MIGWYTRREASLPFEVSFLSAESERSMLIGYFFLPTEAWELSPPPPPPPPLYHLAVVITSADSAHSRFAIENWRFPTSVGCYDITAVKLQTKKYTFWDINWNELWILLTLNRPPPPIFTSKFWGGCASLASPNEPPLVFISHICKL